MKAKVAQPDPTLTHEIRGTQRAARDESDDVFKQGGGTKAGPISSSVLVSLPRPSCGRHARGFVGRGVFDNWNPHLRGRAWPCARVRIAPLH